MSRPFRQPAVDAQQTKWLGDVFLVRPMSFAFYVVGASIMAAAIIAFLLWGTYTKRTTVSGQLMPGEGLLRLYSPQSAVVVDQRLEQGERVEEGDVLYVLSSERYSASIGETQASVSDRVRERMNALETELKQRRQLMELERQDLKERIESVKEELRTLDTLIQEQRRRLELAKAMTERYRKLQTNGYVSQDSVVAREADLVEQRAQLARLRRDKIVARRALNDNRNRIGQLPLEYESDKANLKRALASTAQELTISEAKREVLVKAPVDGTVGAVIRRRGQLVSGSGTLALIVPDGAELEAQFYAPSSAIGFVEAGDQVRLRYEAYPHEKFGRHAGEVEAVTRVAVSAAELPMAQDFAPPFEQNGGAGNQHVFQITVGLPEQTIEAYGRAERLEAGMRVNADILQETRRLYEWALEPLYAISGRM